MVEVTALWNFHSLPYAVYPYLCLFLFQTAQNALSLTEAITWLSLSKFLRAGRLNDCGGRCIRWYNKGKKYGLEDDVEGVDPWDILPWSKYSDTRNGLERPFLSPTQYLLFCVCLQLVPHPKGQTWNAAAEMRNSTTVTIYIAFFWEVTPFILVDTFLAIPLPPFCAAKFSEVVSPRDGCRLEDNVHVDIHDTRG